MQALVVGLMVAAMALVLSVFPGGSQPDGIDIPQLPPAATEDEPLISKFSLESAAYSLDSIALNWQEAQQCAACHTLPPYLMARPWLNAVSPEPPDIRRFFERIVEERLEGEPDLPTDGISAIIIQTAAGLAFHDRATTGKLHSSTKKQLDRMWTLQRDDGSWEWPFRDTPPIKSDEHYGVVFAALAAGAAPENYSGSTPAVKGLAGIRKYLAAHPPYSLHQKAMLLWAETYVEGLISATDVARSIEELTGAQRSDGGWSLASLTENPADPDRQTEEGGKLRAAEGHGRDFLVYVGREKAYKSSLESDGYATGLTVYILRQTGVPSDDSRIRSGVAWIKEHQRASGRWFTPSQSWSTRHYIANAGTAYCILALQACGEIK